MRAKTRSTSRSRLNSENVTMSPDFRSILRFLISDEGPTAVEYAVMLGLIIVAAVGVVTSLTTSVSGLFSGVSSSINSAS